MSTKPTLILPAVFRWLLGLLLLWAALSKLANPTEFLGDLLAYGLPLPRLGLEAAAMVVPWLELLCGLLLVLDFWAESALAGLIGLLAAFLVATGQAWVRGLEITCGCFDLSIFGIGGPLSRLSHTLESPGSAFVRNLFLAFIAAALFRRCEPSRTLAEATPR